MIHHNVQLSPRVGRNSRSCEQGEQILIADLSVADIYQDDEIERQFCNYDAAPASDAFPVGSKRITSDNGSLSALGFA